MNKWNPSRTEFYETAVKMGFYGKEEAGLTGKKDNVRKFWEDIFMKKVCGVFVEKILGKKKRLRVLDLGAGSGEGYELLTHIPPSSPISTVDKHFMLDRDAVELYLGIDISPSMLSQGRLNYRERKNIIFEYGNLEEGLPASALQSKPFDVYLSTYGSLSHLEPKEFEKVIEQIFKHAGNGSVVIFDVHGKYSPSWPKYWGIKKHMLPYTMAYLEPAQKRKNKQIEWFNVCFWDADELENSMLDAAGKTGIRLDNVFILDRSIFVGRHMDTGLMSTKALPIRYQVNRLLDHGYRADVSQLKIELDHLEEYKCSNEKVWVRLTDYERKWNRVLILLEALQHHDDSKVKNFIENTDIEQMSDELKFLTWLFRNADRFPVADFWASVIGPQVAVVLRNIEMSYSKGVGCGHGLVFAAEIIK